ncbi:unnamed protein product [Chrysoparadoxa australica]
MLEGQGRYFVGVKDAVERKGTDRSRPRLFDGLQHMACSDNFRKARIRKGGGLGSERRGLQSCAQRSKMHLAMRGQQLVTILLVMLCGMQMVWGVMAEPDADVIVVGAGAAGLSTAYFLSKRGRTVRVLEKQSETTGLAPSYQAFAAEYFLPSVDQHGDFETTDRAKAFLTAADEARGEVDSHCGDLCKWVSMPSIAYGRGKAAYHFGYNTYKFIHEDAKAVNFYFFLRAWARRHPNIHITWGAEVTGVDDRTHTVTYHGGSATARQAVVFANGGFSKPLSEDKEDGRFLKYTPLLSSSTNLMRDVGKAHNLEMAPVTIWPAEIAKNRRRMGHFLLEGLAVNWFHAQTVILDNNGKVAPEADLQAYGTRWADPKSLDGATRWYALTATPVYPGMLVRLAASLGRRARSQRRALGAIYGLNSAAFKAAERNLAEYNAAVPGRCANPTYQSLDIGMDRGGEYACPTSIVNGHICRLAPITGQIYWQEVFPSMLDTNSGPLLDEHNQVLGLEGKYAVGNAATPMLGAPYYAAGATLGNALVGSYVAVRHITQGDKPMPEHSPAWAGDDSDPLRQNLRFKLYKLMRTIMLSFWGRTPPELEVEGFEARLRQWIARNLPVLELDREREVMRRRRRRVAARRGRRAQR